MKRPCHQFFQHFFSIISVCYLWMIDITPDFHIDWKMPSTLVRYFVDLYNKLLHPGKHRRSASVCLILVQHRRHWSTIGVLGWLLVVVLFAPIRGGSLGICFVCWMLLRHCTEALVYSNHPRAAAASSYLAIIFGRIASGVPWFLRSTAEPMQHPHQCWRWCRLW